MSYVAFKFIEASVRQPVSVPVDCEHVPSSQVSFYAL